MVASVAGPAGLTVDELARRVDMTVRNVREYQRLGLLPAPERRGRIGYYARLHVERIERIQALRASGFPLHLIRRVLDDDEGVAALARAAGAPFQDERPEEITREAFIERFRVTSTTSLTKAIEVGLLRDLGDGRLKMPSPRLARVGDAMIRIGLTLDDMLDLMRDVRSHQDAVAQLFFDVFRERVWDPYVEAGAPPDGVDLVTELLDLVRPRALDTVAVAFELAMDAKVADLLGEIE
jgi:DNA-binding transcriptional MerR regulator